MDTNPLDGAPASGLITSHRDLVAWQRSYRLGLALYEITVAFPDDERFGLTSQLRRAAVAVASNIAEGRARNSKPEFVRFLRMSMGGLAEIDTQLRFAGDLDYITPGQCGRLLVETSECAKLINALINGLRRGIDAERKRSKRITPPSPRADPHQRTASPTPNS